MKIFQKLGKLVGFLNPLALFDFMRNNNGKHALLSVLPGKISLVS